MAFIKTPDGGYFVDDRQVEIDYEKNRVILLTGEGQAYLPLAGGTMDADSTIGGENSLTIGIDTNNIKFDDTSVEIGVGTAKATVTDQTIDLHETALVNVNSVSGGASGMALESEVDMNNHKITGLADPTDSQDAMTKGKADDTYALKTAIPTLATTSQAGLVKKGVAVADVTGGGGGSSATTSTLNALLASLRAAGIIAT